MENTLPLADGKTAPPSVVVQLVTNLNPVAVFGALASEFRWAVLQWLAAGPPRTASEVASAFRREFDGVSKHLRLMRDVGVIGGEVGEDRRETVYSIPAVFRATPGLIDYGVCQVRLPDAKKANGGS